MPIPSVGGKHFDMRVSILPTVHGQSVVMRILDRGNIQVSIRELGFGDDDYTRFQSVIKRPNGIFLVTGPTGSGKTTTLYAALSPGQWESFGLASAIYDPSEILNPNAGLANVLTNISNPKSQSRETINGQSTIKITGTASADAVNGLAPQLKATQPAPTTAWVEENGDHQLAQVQLEQTPGNSVQMTLSNWNTPVQVTKPPVAGG